MRRQSSTSFMILQRWTVRRYCSVRPNRFRISVCLQLFYAGYNPSPWYNGHNDYWILRALNAEKPIEKKKQEDPKKGIIELSMPLCCEGCILKVHKKLKPIDGKRFISVELWLESLRLPMEECEQRMY